MAAGSSRFFLRSMRTLLKEKPVGAFGALITVILLLTGIFADFLAPHGMNEVNRHAFLAAPSREFPLGTDNLGRDLLSRVIYGARISIIVGLAASAISTVGATILGLVSGYLGGKVDLLLQRAVDAIMAIPGLIMLLVIMALVGPGMLEIILVLGLGGAIGGSRIVRGDVIKVKQNVYTQAATAVGSRTSGILFRHILPNVMAPIIVLFSITVPGMILTEASLSFLGLGIPPPAPSWGGMLGGSGRRYMFLAPWMVIWPGLALAIVVYGVNMFGDALRDVLDPRLRGGSGRYGVLRTSRRGRSGLLVSGSSRASANRTAKPQSAL
ncbi:MAG: ABC transporter permease [Spirochaetaceae bacterium]|nr:ABC transporter permease [Spirochaetaceae bacterium]